MKLWKKDTYICNDCGYNTTEFHHRPCKRCRSYEFKERVVTTYLSWNTYHGGKAKFPYLKIRKVMFAPRACRGRSYTDAGKVFRDFRKRSRERRDDFKTLSTCYRMVCKSLLKTMRDIKEGRIDVKS